MNKSEHVFTLGPKLYEFAAYALDGNVQLTHVFVAPNNRAATLYAIDFIQGEFNPNPAFCLWCGHTSVEECYAAKCVDEFADGPLAEFVVSKDKGDCTVGAVCRKGANGKWTSAGLLRKARIKPDGSVMPIKEQKMQVEAKNFSSLNLPRKWVPLTKEERKLAGTGELC
jgi:hypothetical protein